MPDLNLLLAVFLIIFFASIVRGLSGFGLAMIALPLLSLILPYRQTVVLLVAVNLSFSIVHLIKSKGLIKSGYFVIIIVFSSLGVTAGVLLLNRINNEILRACAGLVILIFAILMISGYRLRFTRPGMAYSLASLIGGILAGSASIGGPVAALMLGGTKLKHDEFRYSMSVFFLVSYTYSTALYSVTGSIDPEQLLLIVFCIPSMIAGFLLGERLTKIINERKIRTIVLLLLVLAGILTTWKGLAALLA